MVRGTLVAAAGFGGNGGGGGGGGGFPFAADVSGVRHCAPDAPAHFVLEAGYYTTSLSNFTACFVCLFYLNPHTRGAARARAWWLLIRGAVSLSLEPT